MTIPRVRKIYITFMKELSGPGLNKTIVTQTQNIELRLIS